MVNYYVDPGSGFVFIQNTSFLWAIILGFLGGFFFFFRLFFRFFKRFLRVFFILILLVILAGLTIMMYKPLNRKKVIVVGIDAMDPNITEGLLQKEKLPNFTYLKAEGSYAHLLTTVPAESVVAWTSFSTGLNPASHGIFDFIMRDPKNYLPYLTLNEILNVGGKIEIKIRKKGDAFWKILSKKKIPCFIYFCPNTFPPEHLLGRMLSGMGVTDILGTMGKFSFYTTRASDLEDRDSKGRIIQVKPDKDIILTEIYGPKVLSEGLQAESKLPLKIILMPAGEKICLEFQGKRFFLTKENWSNWLRVSFKIGPFRKAYGIVRFYLKAIEPDFQLYMSPINFDPQKPFFSLSYPAGYSKKLAKKIGLYYTQGMPHDTWALTEDRLDEKAFLEEVDEILDERVKILKAGLKEFRGGLFFFYFDTLDIIQHMFWRYIDQKHPLYEENSLYQDTIFKYYEKMDKIIGEILKGIDKDTTLIVLSDHGFNSFRKGVHLNLWLKESGYLFLKEGIKESKEFFEGVDWPKTKAYALGFGGIYLNRMGREYYGIVGEPEAGDLKQKIINGLKGLCDPKNGEMVVRNVYTQEEVFDGPYKNDAPDLFVGFNAGYRASWQTALGGIPNTNVVIEDNRRKWSGDHLIDPALVPGVIFVNKRVQLCQPHIVDIAPTILGLFNINKPQEMPGKALFKGYEDKDK